MTSIGNKIAIKTRVFDPSNGKYRNLSELAHAMGLSLSQVTRVREGKRNINQKFIVGAKRAFPQYDLDDLFYFDAANSGSSQNEPEVITHRYHHIVEKGNGHFGT